MSDKADAFHRLAAKRLESVQDQIRIFSNLSGPSYEWTPSEVLSYFDRIQAALTEAMGRFKDQKRWRLAMPEDAPPEPPAAPPAATILAEDAPEPEPKSPPPRLADVNPKRRQQVIDVLDTYGNDPELLAEIIAMQREVLYGRQTTEEPSG